MPEPSAGILGHLPESIRAAWWASAPLLTAKLCLLRSRALCRCEGERIVFTIVLLLVLMTETILRRAIASASAAFLDAWSLSCLAMSSTRLWNPVSTAI